MIKGSIVGGAETVAFVEGVPNKVRESIYQAINRLTLELLRHVKQDKLSGQVLNVKTGRLRRSINNSVEDVGNSITGSVGTNVEYAKALEYGFKGDVSVKAHLRKNKNGGACSVRAHQRNMNLPARSFLHSALDDMRQQIRDDITGAVHNATMRLK